MLNSDVWVVMPCFDEADVLASVVADLLPLGCSVVVVDDGSAVPAARQITDPTVRVVRHCVNLGQGAALQTGFDFALEHGAEYLVTFDSDGQHMPSEIESLVEPLRNGTAEVALGTRFAMGGAALNISRKRAAVLKLATILSRTTTGLNITDTHNGFRAFTRAAASRIRITQNRMAHASQILEEIARSRMRYVEVPVTIRYTQYSQNKGQKLANGFNILWESMTEMFSR
jgi:glycosyltransferase involved in cell wall biosynthesis